MVYINDVHILWYVLIAFLGGAIGQFVDYIPYSLGSESIIESG